MHDLVSEIKKAALESGYIDCGITDAQPFDTYAEALKKRIKDFPDSSTLYEPMFNRVDPRHSAPWVNSIVVCVHHYGKFRLPAGVGRHIGRNYLADRRTEANPDHEIHKAFSARLKSLGLRIKRGGVPERLAGARAGVVSIGRNGFAYHNQTGSWINIESWRVDAALPPDKPDYDCPCPDGCSACIDACPTKALCAPFLMHMDHCIAHLTYRAERPIADHLWQAMGEWIYGCDICQLVCPLNKGKWRDDIPMPWLDIVSDLLKPEALAVMDEETYRRKIFPLFWYISENDVERWHANARRACETLSVRL